MIYLVRIITALGLFVLLFLKLWLGALFLGGFIMAVSEDKLRPVNNPGFEDDYFTAISVVVLGASLVMAAGVSFTGILPWCQKTAPATAGPPMALAPIPPAATCVMPKAAPAPVMPRSPTPG